MIRNAALIILLLFMTALSSCVNSAPIQATSTLIPTLVPTTTSTFTPEPTATLTPVPTATPFQYTSCLDEEAKAAVLKNAEQVFGMSVNDKIEQAIADGLYLQDTGYDIDLKITTGDVIALGYEVASVRESNLKVLCMYVAQEFSGDNPIPVVLSMEKDGRYYAISPLFENNPDREGYFVWAGRDIESLEEMQDFASTQFPAGTVFHGTFMDFDDIDTAEEAKATYVAGRYQIISPPLVDNVFWFIEVLDNDFIARMEGQDLQYLASHLDPAMGDQGLLAAYLEVKE